MECGDCSETEVLVTALVELFVDTCILHCSLRLLGFSIDIHKYVFCAFAAYFSFTHCLDSGNDAGANNFSLNFELST